jgi:hypothetical protein
MRDAVKDALDLGWTAKRGGKGGWKLRSPGGTQWMHVSPATNIPDHQANMLRSKMAKAALMETTPQSEDLRVALNDPKQGAVTMVCTACKVEFLTWDGFVAHQQRCVTANPAAWQDVEEESDEPEADSPSEGRTERAETDDVEKTETSVSGKMSNKEEVNMGGAGRGRYRKSQSVQPGLARAIYEAMRQRSNHKNEALSVYANVIAGMVIESGIEIEELPGMSDAEVKLQAVITALGIDIDALGEVDTIRDENKRLKDLLATWKELVAGSIPEGI